MSPYKELAEYFRIYVEEDEKLKNGIIDDDERYREYRNKYHKTVLSLKEEFIYNNIEEIYSSKGLDVLSNMMSQGKITFLTNKVDFDYQAIEEAIKMLKSRRTRGKLVCNIIEENNLI